MRRAASSFTCDGPYGGRLIFTRRQCYALPEKMELIKGYVIGVGTELIV
ncbi:hypothetical protein O9992_10665 [Vibrio lentus]|nr:hypothetical protein [Vibrio lentus]